MEQKKQKKKHSRTMSGHECPMSLPSLLPAQRCRPKHRKVRKRAGGGVDQHVCLCLRCRFPYRRTSIGVGDGWSGCLNFSLLCLTHLTMPPPTSTHQYVPVIFPQTNSLQSPCSGQQPSNCALFWAPDNVCGIFAFVPPTSQKILHWAGARAR